MTLTQIKFEDLTNEDRLEINKRLIVSLANSVGENYQNYLLGTKSNIQEITDSINEFSDALRFIGVRSSHFINAMLLTGFFNELMNKNKGNNDKNCFVYALYCKETGMTKIGKTTRFKQRMKEIQGMSSGKLQLILKVCAAPNLETKLHQKYSGFRNHGEWFLLDEITRANLKKSAIELINQG